MTQRKNVRAAKQEQKSMLPLIGLLAVAGVLLVAGLSLLLTNNGSTSGGKTGPRVTIDRERIDFGRVPLDKSVRAEFKITNAGDRPLTLDTTAPVQALQGCWPPKAVVGSTTLQPGESTTVSAEFMMHQGMEGPHLFDVTVKTNDPAQLVKHLYIASDWEAGG